MLNFIENTKSFNQLVDMHYIKNQYIKNCVLLFILIEKRLKLITTTTLLIHY